MIAVPFSTPAIVIVAAGAAAWLVVFLAIWAMCFACSHVDDVLLYDDSDEL